MKSQDRYFIGPGLRDKLRDMVRAHDSSFLGDGGAEIPTRLQDMMRGGGGSKLRLGKTTAAWLRNTSGYIEIWDKGEPPDEEISSPLETITAYNKMYDVAACVWVIVGKVGGNWYLVEAATPDPSEGGCKAPNISGHDLTTVTGYASNKKQALTHDENACLKWVDIEDCA